MTFEAVGMIATSIATLFTGAVSWFKYLDFKKDKEKLQSDKFHHLVETLSDGNEFAKLSAAVTLRSYIQPNGLNFNKKLSADATHIILALLKITPTCQLQKLLADGLSGAKVDKWDFQRANLSDVYIEGQNFDGADFFGCYAFKGSLKRSSIKNAFFNSSKFNNFAFKNCDLNGSNFSGADLTGCDFSKADITKTKFIGCILNGCNFSEVTGADSAEFENITTDDKTLLPSGISLKSVSNKSSRNVFISKPSTLSQDQFGYYSRIRQTLMGYGYNILSIDPPDYYPFGVVENIRHKILSSDVVIVMAFVQVHAESALCKPGTDQSETKSISFPTAWNQLEAGIALGANKKVLVLKEASLNDGVFVDELHGAVQIRKIVVNSTDNAERSSNWVIEQLRDSL